MDRTSDSAADITTSEVRRLFELRGAQWYGGEAVSQLEHALQAATFAEREASPPALVVAALLHDVGHLLHGLPEDVAAQGLDDRHEALATAWLSKRFGPAVVEPVGMHVAAKRYLCAVDREYARQLSPASQQSLRVQGGPMTADEAGAFEHRPHFADAVRLRKWDDAAKVVGLQTPPLEHFASYIQRAALAATS
jgi:phosphonate degradation associated HDIG domain protein